LEAFRDHGKANLTITRGLEEAQLFFAELKAAGVSMKTVTQELEEEGVKSFADSFATLLQAIEERRKNAVSSLGPLADSVPSVICAGKIPVSAHSAKDLHWQMTAGQAEVKIRPAGLT
jgi:hypothetical protein